MRAFLTENPGLLKDRIPAIYGYLNNFAGGRDPTPAADFYPELSREQVAQLSLQVTDEALRYRPVLREYEHGRISKFGPQGGIPSLDDPLMVETIDRYYRPNKPCNPDERTIRSVVKFIRDAQLKPYTFAEVVARQSREGTKPLKTNTGAPWFAKREDYIGEAIYAATRGQHYPAIVGARSIRNGLRTIYMYDMATNLTELQYVYPIMDWLCANTGFTQGWLGPDYVDEAVGQQFTEDGVYHLSTDFSKMDTTVGRAQVELASRVIPYFFEKRYRADVRESLKALVTKPVILCAVKRPGRGNTPDHQDQFEHPAWEFAVTDQDHGLLSGSGWTNCLETILAWILACDVDRTEGITYLKFQLLGDDGEATIDAETSKASKFPEIWTQHALRMGFDANVEKQHFSTSEVWFLQRGWIEDETRYNGVVHGSYPALLAVNSAKNPERWVSVPNSQASDRQRAMEAVRLISIGNNCQYNPAFDSIVKMFVDGSPSRCGLDLPKESFDLAYKARSFLVDHGLATWEEIGVEDPENVTKALYRSPFMQTLAKLVQDGEI